MSVFKRTQKCHKVKYLTTIKQKKLSCSFASWFQKRLDHGILYMHMENTVYMHMEKRFAHLVKLIQILINCNL